MISLMKKLGLAHIEEASEKEFDWKGHKFVVRKYEGGWRVYPIETPNTYVGSGMNAADAQKNAVEVLDKHGEEGYKKAMGDVGKKVKSKEELQSADTAAKFKHFFQTDIHPFIVDPRLNVLGYYQFNIVKFDEWLRTPDGTSTKDYIKQKYGDEASAFIEHLIHLV